MSAGKSTLINAMAGRPLFRMAQEVCTSTVCQLYNKAFDDGAIDLSAEKLQLCANVSDLRNTKWEQPVAISVGFVGEFAQMGRICMIDTPGVDAALHERHGKITYDELKQTEVDRVLYVMNPTSLGTDAEWKHLQWVAQQIPHEKIFFILNKVDDYRPECDDIAQSIESLREQIRKEKEKAYKERLKQREKERKAKEKAYKQKLKEREKARKAELKAKEQARKEAQKAKEAERKARLKNR